LLAEALEIARDIGDRQEEAEGLRSHGLSELFQGRLESAPIWFRRSMQRFQELGDRRGVAWNLVNLAWADLLLGRLDEANGFLSEGLEIFSDLGDAEGAGWCLGLRAWVLVFQGKLAEAEALQHQIDGMIVQAMRPTPRGMGSFGWAIGRVCLAFIALDRVRLAETIELAEQGIEVFSESDAVWGLAMGRFPLGIAQLLSLRVDDARETFKAAGTQADRSSDPMVRALVTYGKAMAEFYAGNLDDAERLVDDSMKLTEGTGVSWISDVPGRTLKGQIYRERGRMDEALRFLEEIVQVEAGLYEESRAASVRSEILSDLDRASEAVEVAGRGIDEAGEDVCGSAMCHRAKARAHHLLGDLAEAERLIRAELEVVLAASDWNEERFQALALLAKVLDGQGRHDEAGVAVDEARSLLGSFARGAQTDRLARLLSV
jgi:tetratricopeptide (TPR) repeat protein